MAISPQHTLGVVRVSTSGQIETGDSPDHQKLNIEYFCNNKKLPELIIYELAHSATSNELKKQALYQVVEYVRNHPELNIKFVVFSFFDRFTRGGAEIYIPLKKLFQELGVTLLDTGGVISAEVNNTLEHLGKSYKWSVYSPSEKGEILKAEEDKSSTRDMLSRLIGSEISYVREGYANGPAELGYRNIKVDTEEGKRTVREPNPPESEWVKKIYELSAQHVPEERIVEIVNLMGFKTRTMKKRDRLDRKKIIGLIGGRPLKDYMIPRILEKPIYAGINVHKFLLKGEAVKAKFEGLVSIDLWNKANQGRRFIIEREGKYKVVKKLPPEYTTRKSRFNPQFPFKGKLCPIMCPDCSRLITGSVSKGKKDHYSFYHGTCTVRKNGHSFRVSKKAYEDTLKSFVQRLKMDEKAKTRWKQIVLQKWYEKIGQTKKESISAQERVTDLDATEKMLYEKLKMVTLPEIVQKLESEIADVMIQKKKLKEVRTDKEEADTNIEEVIKLVGYYFEHLDEVIFSGTDYARDARLFGMLFAETPHFDQFKTSNTEELPKLKPAIVHIQMIKDFENTLSAEGGSRTLTRFKAP